LEQNKFWAILPMHPLLQTKLTASNGTVRDFFGYQLSISGNVLVVGGFHSEARVLKE
jgi:hypothetical protein